MSALDWCILIIPLLAIMALAVYARRYVRGVADFIAAGRVADRYVIAVGDMENAFSVLVLVSLAERLYQCGFAMNFWNQILIPIALLVSLTGFCVYRYRETRALSAGQFLEMRYSRSFRITAGVIRTMAEMTTNAIGPAIAARFFMYFIGVPSTLRVLGVQLQTFPLFAFIIVFTAVLLILPGGRVSLIITDTIQGLLAYPVFVVLAIFILMRFSWSEQIIPTLSNRVDGESFLNPYDVEKLRDFNIFALIVSIFGAVLNRASWLGGDATGAGRTAHEQKMAGVLGTFRGGFSAIACTLLAVMLITLMYHPSCAPQARNIRNDLIGHIAKERVSDPMVRNAIIDKTAGIPDEKIYLEGPASRKNNPDTVYMDVVHDELGKTPDGNRAFQEFRSLYSQMKLPVAVRKVFPIGLIGLFALLAATLMISSDDSRILNSAVIICQDLILPCLKKPLSSKGQMRLLRICVVAVGAYFFLATVWMSQLDYIAMFTTIICSIWLGGAGAVVVGGLYTRWGTTAGAYAALLCGSGLSIWGYICQCNWAKHIYPWLTRTGYIVHVQRLFDCVTEHCSPIIVWEMSDVKFPINSMEIYLAAMIVGIASYVGVSLLTCKKPFNLDRMLHRGVYSVAAGEKSPIVTEKKPGLFQRLIGISPQYTRGDKIIAYSVFAYSFVYNLCIAFLGVVIWNLISPWHKEWWGRYFLVISIIVPVAVAVISTVWMSIGGVIDLRKLFRNLAARRENDLDNGVVSGHVSLVDRKTFDKLEKSEISAHNPEN